MQDQRAPSEKKKKTLNDPKQHRYNVKTHRVRQSYEDYQSNKGIREIGAHRHETNIAASPDIWERDHHKLFNDVKLLHFICDQIMY